MANFQDYSLRYFSCSGTYLGDFDSIVSLDYGRQKCEIGMAELVLPGIYDLTLFNKDCVLEIWRLNVETNEKELMGGTCWFLRKVQVCLEDGQKETITLTFYDTLHLLSRRFVAWFEVQRGFADGEFPGNYPSSINNRPDIVLDMIVYYNFITAGLSSSPLDPAPDDGDPFTDEFRAINLHQLVDAPNTGFPLTLQNPSFIDRDSDVDPRTYSFAYAICLDAMNDVVNTAEATENRELWFDIVYTPSSNTDDLNPIFGSLEFNVWWDFPGADHTFPDSEIPLLFGPEYNNIKDPCLVLDWENEATRVFAVGGSADNTVVGLENLANGVTIPSTASYADRVDTDSCPFYPIEAYISDSQDQNNNEGEYTSTILDSTASKAYAELRKRAPVHTLTGNLVQTADAYLFINYKYGDLVTVDWKKLTFDASIKKFMITVDNEGEVISIPFEGTVRQRFLI